MYLLQSGTWYSVIISRAFNLSDIMQSSKLLLVYKPFSTGCIVIHKRTLLSFIPRANRKNSNKQIEKLLDLALCEYRFTPSFKHDFKKHFLEGFRSKEGSMKSSSSTMSALNLLCSVSNFLIIKLIDFLH